MKTIRNPGDVHAPIAGYSHQIEISGPERLLALSGQVGRTLAGDVPPDGLDQLDLAFENLQRNLSAAGMGVEDLVKLNLYLVGETDPARRREIITRRLQGFQPCMTLVYVVALASPIYKVEIDAWASRAE